jgi:Planctomycete extracellular.
MSSVFQFLSRKQETINSKKSRKQLSQSARHLLFEPLEERQMLAIVAWDGGGDGKSWGDAANWSGNALPTKDDDVVIDLTTLNPVIEVNTGNDIAIKSLTSNERITMTGGILDVSGIALLKQDFSLLGGTLKNGIWDTQEDMQFAVTGTAAFSGVTLLGTVQVGGTLSVTSGMTENHQLWNDRQ